MGSGSPTCPRTPPSFSPPSTCGLSSTSRSQTSTSRPSPISNEPSQSAASFSMAISSASVQTSTGGPSRPSRANQPDSVSDLPRGLKSFAIGDRVLFLKTERDVKNGMLGTVEGLGLNALTVRTDRGETVDLKPSDYEHFSHGYAATVHKAQGATVDRTLVYGSALMDRHLAYVALTRHRDDAVLYASREVFGTVADLARRFSRDGSASTTLDHDFMRQRVTIADAALTATAVKMADPAVRVAPAAAQHPVR